MVGIVRNADITFDSKEELQDFEKRINNQVPRVSMKELIKEVKADGIVITRGKDEAHE